MKKIESSNSPLRVALYIRVSGEEQKMKGLSLEAQQERLEEYARERGWIIVGTYIDAAKTARKEMRKRTEFQKMIASVKRDEVDLLLFCRLDRWFRSVADYYKIMEILQAHHCDWKTTDEEYDTSTANGRLYINVKLSIAQNEADICGERIDVVFDSKIQHGTVVSGACPYGYRVNADKKLEIDPDAAAIVQDAFNNYETVVSQRGTIRYIREKYGVNWCDATFHRMLTEPLYIGLYDRGGAIIKTSVNLLSRRNSFIGSRIFYLAMSGKRQPDVYISLRLLLPARNAIISWLVPFPPEGIIVRITIGVISIIKGISVLTIKLSVRTILKTGFLLTFRKKLISAWWVGKSKRLSEKSKLLALLIKQP